MKGYWFSTTVPNEAARMLEDTISFNGWLYLMARECAAQNQKFSTGNLNWTELAVSPFWVASGYYFRHVNRGDN